MKFIYITIAIFLSLSIFTSCSKEPDEPYFDRAKQASQKAQNQLSKD
ncbi:hypothetical protein N9X61_03905 [Sulfurimonas sp.]|nr:hypothetical protein [Sulfurimonas sp.]